jgi:hypothetical protein
MNFAHRLTHNGLKLEYLNSICRWTPSNDIIFAFYGQSTLICGQCNDIVFFRFSGRAKTVRAECYTCEKPVSWEDEVDLDEQVYESLFKTPNKPLNQEHS